MTTWDVNNAKPQRLLMIPKESPFYMAVRNDKGEEVLWFSREKGTRVANWHKAGEQYELVRWRKYLQAVEAIAINVKEFSSKVVLDHGLPVGDYTVSLISQRGNTPVINSLFYVR